MTTTDPIRLALAAGLTPVYAAGTPGNRPKRTPDQQARIDRMAAARAEGTKTAKDTALEKARAARAAKRTATTPKATVTTTRPAVDPEQQLWDRVRGEQPDTEPTKAEADTLRSIWSNTTEQDPADTELYRSVYGS